MENYEPLSESESKIFNIKEIHKRYWKKFCDRFYKNFRFPEGTDWDYEKKFEYFCKVKYRVMNILITPRGFFRSIVTN